MKQIKIFITRRGIAYFEQKKLVEQQLQEQAAKDKQIQKEQRQHEYRLTLFNIIGGGIAGLITSLIFWLITK